MRTRKSPSVKKSPAHASSRTHDGRIIVESVNVPGYTSRVNGAKYRAMRHALLRVLPRNTPGLTQAEMFRAVLAHLPEALFPGGAKTGWWAKTVQLDLEAKGVVRREATKPLRWHRTKEK